MNTIIKTFSFLLLSFIIISCNQPTKEIRHNEVLAEVVGIDDFHNAVCNLTAGDLSQAGIEFGDVVNVIVDDSIKFENIPYFDGYYASIGMYQLCAYCGINDIVIAISGSGICDINPIVEGSQIQIVLSQPQAAKSIQKCMGAQFTDRREDYPNLDNDQYANARCCQYGNIAPNRLYRSSSPFNNRHNRDNEASDFAKRMKVNCVLDLADTSEELNDMSGDMPEYTLQILQNGNVIASKINSNYMDNEYNATLIESLTKMAHHDGPYLINCVEGKDRTGYVCALLEGLCGASWEEIVKDYMTTYYNYFGIDKDSNIESYNAFIDNRLIPMMLYYCSINSEEEIANIDISSTFKKYLINKGMKPVDVDLLIQKLTN